MFFLLMGGLVSAGNAEPLHSERQVAHAAVKAAFDRWAPAPSDERGYVATPEQNLLPGVWLDQFAADLEKGAGHELAGKFRAVHSSSALAVNTFGPFRDQPAALVLLGARGYDPPVFEKELSTGLRGTGPTLDVFLRRGEDLVAIESKFLEYFSPKEAHFSPRYVRRVFPWAEDGWWRVLEGSQCAGRRNLDVAQLVKHYLGLGRLMDQGGPGGFKPRRVTLLYLYWEPANAPAIEACRRHRAEIAELAAHVAGSRIAFRSMSYPSLWAEWAALPECSGHASNLAARYVFPVAP